MLSLSSTNVPMAHGSLPSTVLLGPTLWQQKGIELGAGCWVFDGGAVEPSRLTHGIARAANIGEPAAAKITKITPRWQKNQNRSPTAK